MAGKGGVSSSQTTNTTTTTTTDVVDSFNQSINDTANWSDVGNVKFNYGESAMSGLPVPLLVIAGVLIAIILTVKMLK